MNNLIKGVFSTNTKRSEKTNQKLGIDVESVFNKFMQAEKSGFADKTEFNYFWLAMKDESPGIDIYIHLLVDILLLFMSRNHKLPFNAQVLLNTINFIVLRHKITLQSKPVRDILTKWHRNRQKYDDNTLPAAKDVLGVLYKQRVEGQDGLDSLIIQCYQFYSHDELARIADYYQYPTILHIVDGAKNIGMSSGDKVCIWPYLKDIALSNPDRFSMVILNTIAKLRTIGGAIFLSPKLAEISLLALIFMTRQLISYTRIPNEAYLDKCISNLKSFYLWPIPYGTQARDLLIKLQKERIAPGYSLLQKVWRECRLPEIELNTSIMMNNNNSASGRSITDVSNENSFSFRPLFYLFDLNDSASILVANIMKIDAQSDWGNDYNVHVGPSPFTCAVLILNIITHDCGHSLELVNSIKALKANEIVQFYKECIDIFVSSSSNDSAVAKQARIEGLTELRKEIIAYASEKETEDELEDELLENELHFEHLEHLPTNGDYRVELPVLHHTGIGSDLQKMVFPNVGQMASNEIIFPSNDVLLKITSLLKNLKELATNEDPITLRFMIAGGNSILNAVITAYATLLRHGQNLLENFNVEFFILPYSKNHFAEWIARQDPWYNRHIYLPLQSELFIAPALLPDTRAKLTDTGYLHTVGKFYRDMSENYAREADQMVPLRMWQLLCWEQPPYTKTPHKLIPFCQRVEVGKLAEYHGQLSQMYDIEQQNKIPGNLDEFDIIYDNDEDFENESKNDYSGTGSQSRSGSGVRTLRANTNVNGKNNELLVNGVMDDEEFALGLHNFDYQPIVVDVEWNAVDMLGRAELMSVQQKNQSVEHLFVASVPRYLDKGFPASPEKSGVIHMYVELRNLTYGRKKKYQEFALFKSEPSQHVRSCTVTSNKSSDMFWVLVDDQIYGQFSKIKIQPMIDPFTKQHAYLPVRTFFPIQGM